MHPWYYASDIVRTITIALVSATLDESPILTGVPGHFCSKHRTEWRYTQFNVTPEVIDVRRLLEFTRTHASIQNPGKKKPRINCGAFLYPTS